MTVLIIADQAEFARDVVGRWHNERHAPEFVVLGSDVWQESAAEFDIAIVSPMETAPLLQMLKRLSVSKAPVLCVARDSEQCQKLREDASRALVLCQDQGGWLEALILVGSEMLRRVDAVQRARRAEESAACAHRHASLGLYMLDMRHGLNNALTSVLGNAELLLLDSGSLTSEVRDQVDTIHGMALRMHEILQRFSSLDIELQCAEKHSHGETRNRDENVSAEPREAVFPA